MTRQRVHGEADYFDCKGVAHGELLTFLELFGMSLAAPMFV